MTLIDDYLKYQEEYEAKYGSKTIVFIQVGVFYELYGVDNEIETVGRVSEICDLLNIQLTRRNKNITINSRKNPLMGGVNTGIFPKYKSVLLQNGYTVVMAEQFQIKSHKKTKVFERRVTKIFSPGTDIEECTTTDSVLVMSVFIEVINNLHNISISVVDLTTGQSSLFYVCDTDLDKCLAIDQAFKIIHAYEPKEIILVSSNSDIDFKIDLDLDNFIVHTQNSISLSSRIWNINYQNEVLKDVFPIRGLLTPIEFLNLERYPNVVVSYLLIILFVKDHNREILKRIKKPILKHISDELALLGDTLYQLDLLPLYNLLNKTSTSMGKRAFKTRLFTPIISINELQKRYDRIEWMRKEGYEKYELILSKIRDIERYHRKLELGTLNPSEFVILDSSYEHITKLSSLVRDNSQDFDFQESTVQRFKEYRDLYKTYFDLEEMSKHSLVDIKSSFIQKGISEEIDEVQHNIDYGMKILNGARDMLSRILEIGGITSGITLDYVERDGCYYLTTTAKRATLLRKEISRYHNDLSVSLHEIDELKILPLEEYRFKTTSKGTVRITYEEFEINSIRVWSLREKQKIYVREFYLNILDTLYQTYDTILQNIEKFVVDVDILKSAAKVSLMNGYCKPVVVNSERSFLESTELRHPLIEKLHDDVPFISNDIALGKDLNGMILYSINAAGKSTLLRSVGLSVIMAQSGNYVPATSFRFSPYHTIISKIANRDDMIRGQSTFVVEMKNLKTMLLRGNNKTLILGDELCSGTEHFSAIAIVASTILELVERNTNFIFTTHLHKLAKLEEIQKLENVKCFHLKVTIKSSHEESNDGEIVFDRILLPGSGPDTYGIEIAEALDLGQKFILRAKSLRTKLKDGGIRKVTRSRYNSRVKVEKCHICEKLNGLHTHHIKFQSSADSDGMIGPFHKNIKHNLVVVCDNCHHKIHRGNIVINGYKQTTKGVKLDYTYSGSSEH